MNIFKREEKKPFNYSSIEMRKSSRGYIWWIVGILVIIVVIGIFIWI
ncbi:hypothetical protein HYW42_05515 [Candidatus Daviesbacteria bacterium]|nr:hypothetical protein [Candidatus Daviesbacteria bacterium]